MKPSFLKGLSFGLTSGIITTLGMIIGLGSGTNSPNVVIIGIISLAVADSFSDAMGIHLLEESNKSATNKNINEVTFSTFLFKFIFASSFIIPIVIIKDFYLSLIVDIFWGMLSLGILSYFLAKNRGSSPIKTIIEHLLIATLVIILTYFTGKYFNILIN